MSERIYTMLDALAEIERLRAGTLAVNYTRCVEQLTEAAAFLDGMAERLEAMRHTTTNETATDCRAMARKLRGET